MLNQALLHPKNGINFQNEAIKSLLRLESKYFPNSWKQSQFEGNNRMHNFIKMNSKLKRNKLTIGSREQKLNRTKLNFSPQCIKLLLRNPQHSECVNELNKNKIIRQQQTVYLKRSVSLRRKSSSESSHLFYTKKCKELPSQHPMGFTTSFKQRPEYEKLIKALKQEQTWLLVHPTRSQQYVKYSSLQRKTINSKTTLF